MNRKKSKKGITSVVGTALLLVVAVVAILSFQTFFGTYQKNVLANVEQKSVLKETVKIENVIGNSLYLQNIGKNLTIEKIKVGNNFCNLSNLNLNLSSGIYEIKLKKCVKKSGILNVMVLTNKGILEKEFFLNSADCVFNSSFLSNGESLKVFKEKKVFLPKRCESEKRVCKNGILSGSYSFASCVEVKPPFNCSTLSGDWIKVPKNLNLGVDEFCVMKFEAKNDGSDNPVSKPSGAPWTSISQINAKAECESLGEGYKLISNAQWTTIARNIEFVNSNWVDGVVGTGTMFVGHSYGNPGQGLPVYDVNNYYSGIQSGTSYKLLRRVFFLNNSEIIWDLGGNVQEWNRDVCSQGNPWITGTMTTPWTSASLVGVQRSLAGPIGDYTSFHGVGYVYPCKDEGNAFLRGGYHGMSSQGGLYTLWMYYAPSYADVFKGFRCVYEP